MFCFRFLLKKHLLSKCRVQPGQTLLIQEPRCWWRGAGDGVWSSQPQVQLPAGHPHSSAPLFSTGSDWTRIVLMGSFKSPEQDALEGSGSAPTGDGTDRHLAGKDGSVEGQALV